MKYPMTDVISKRYIPWLYPDGTQATIEVCLGTPAPDKAKGGDWYCPYQIKVLKGEERIPNWSLIPISTEGLGQVISQYCCFGVDSFQALLSTLRIIGVEIGTFAGSPDHDNDFPRWSDDPNFGFFIPLTTKE